VIGLLLVSASTLLMSACADACDNVEIDVTIPKPGTLLTRGDAVVVARVIRTHPVHDTALQAELALQEILYVAEGTPELTVGNGTLLVGTTDLPCLGMRSGFAAAEEGMDLLVVISRYEWSYAGVSWVAEAVLAENPDGGVAFLDTGRSLNEQLGEFLPDPTVAGLIEVVRAANET